MQMFYIKNMLNHYKKKKSSNVSKSQEVTKYSY